VNLLAAMLPLAFLATVMLATVEAVPSPVNSNVTRPNIIFLLTDDQDMALGGLTPMKKLKSMVIDKGTLFTNAFVTTPICCPSRSSILTGKYIHNHGAKNNSAAGNCAGADWVNNNEKHTVATSLKALGYRTLFAGKYLNQYGQDPSSPATHVPPGWDNWLGLVGNSRYYDYAVSDNGIEKQHGSDYHKDYFTDLVANRSYEFLADTVKNHPDKPWFMQLATPASHGPDTSAPQYQNEMFGGATAPRNPNYNYWSGDKHWLMRWAPPMTARKQSATDELLLKRWRTLLSVDDIVEQLITRVTALGQMERTYFVFFSDNGYHLGQFCFGADKRQPYEADIRVPFAVMGPGIKAGAVEESLALNIDLMPTITELAGGVPHEAVDGDSLVPLLLHSAQTGTNRKDFLVDYYGEGSPGSGIYGGANPPCIQGQRGGAIPMQSCGDAWNNTYHCIRELVTPQTNETTTRMYCEFSDKEGFKELYEMKADPWQLTNEAYSNKSQHTTVLAAMATRLKELKGCAGPSCRTWRT